MVEQAATLLIVDDERNVLSALRRLLRSHGYQILVAESGEEGLAILKDAAVDLVISDMRMPGMDGADFLGQVANRWPDSMRVLLTGQADVDAAFQAVKEGKLYRFMRKPWDENDLLLTIRSALQARQDVLELRRLEQLSLRQNKELQGLNESLEEKVLARTQEVEQTASFLEMAYSELKNSYMTAIPVFANLVDMREGASKGHGRRVAELARCIAERMGLDEELVQDIYHAGLLHDVGKIGLPDAIVEKPFTELNPKEKKQLESHSALGADVLLALEPLHNAADFIRSHHESYNGKGYPDRLMGDEIPLGGRILRVANDFDSVQLGHLVERAISVSEARGLLKKYSGQFYDPEVASVALELLESEGERFQIDSGGEIRTDSGGLQAGMVLAREVLNPAGILLLPRGARLSATQIQRLCDCELDADRRFIYYIQREAGKIQAE